MPDIDITPTGAPLIEEQETTICLDHQTKRASVYSSKPAVIAMLLDWLQSYRESVVLLHKDEFGIELNVPIEWVKLRAPKRRSKEWSDEARARLAEARAKRWEDKEQFYEVD